MDNQKFRKHPGGVYSGVKVIKVLLLFGLLFSAISAMVALVIMFSENISANVVTRVSEATTAAVKNAFELTNLRTISALNFEPRNVLEWFFLPRLSDFDFHISLLTLIITWQLYRIFKEINLANPFYESISKRLTVVYLIIFYGFIFSILRYAYFMYIIRDLTDNAYNLNAKDYISTASYFSVGTWIIVYLFAYVYKKGVLLQKEQDLTI